MEKYIGFVLLILLWLLLCGKTICFAGIGSQAVRETSEFVGRKVGEKLVRQSVKHADNAATLIHIYGKSAIPFCNNLNRHNARRLARMQADGDLARIGQTDELFGVIGKHGDRAMDFIWRNKGVLVTASVLAAFLADPEPFLDGVQSLVSDGVGSVTKHVVTPVVGKTNWTLVIMFIAGVGVVLYAVPGIVRQIRTGANHGDFNYDDHHSDIRGR